VNRSTYKGCSWGCRPEDSDADIVNCGELQGKGRGEELRGYRKGFYLKDCNEGLYGHFRCDLRHANARRRCGLSVVDLTVVKLRPTPMTHWPSYRYFSAESRVLDGDGGAEAEGGLLWPVTQVEPVPIYVSLLQ